MSKPDPISCEEHIANEIIQMVEEGMAHIPISEQNRRISAFCDDFSAKLHNQANVSEYSKFVLVNREDDALA